MEKNRSITDLKVLTSFILDISTFNSYINHLMYNTFCVAWLVHERGVICHEPHPFCKKGLKK